MLKSILKSPTYMFHSDELILEVYKRKNLKYLDE
jgi:hypothetical protein